MSQTEYLRGIGQRVFRWLFSCTMFEPTIIYTSMCERRIR
ncbi:hypothetical protein BMA10247_2958 [Burkholderia mallei NCTC 10247]|nr:hypothetical protein BMASAVP1_A0060 [Burkholderia mallei SAVP1]ABO05993.1 hypothetical protein BMA10247_2958 [Burkholderia mallei NCTC 10247]EEP88194.1 conserved hypothetical protein [Burkholderia mallei GB8 horse 4]KOS89747.1 hypothetical protein DM45_1783 [Burkholderia mallei]KOT10510.1 hypothetical protein DM77_2994 [Burkholderia mallei]